MLLTELRASGEAVKAWNRAAALLRSWWWDSPYDFAMRRWFEEWGVRIDGIVSERLAVIDIIAAAEQALIEIRGINWQAWHLAQHELRHPNEAWDGRMEDGRHIPGVAYRLGITPTECSRLFAGVQEAMYEWMVQDRRELTTDTLSLLTNVEQNPHSGDNR